MDPNECWKQILSLPDGANQRDKAIPLILALKEWLDKGGFEPQAFDRLLFNALVKWAKI